MNSISLNRSKVDHNHYLQIDHMILKAVPVKDFVIYPSKVYNSKAKEQRWCTLKAQKMAS